MQNKIDDLNRYFDDRISECVQRRQTLAYDQRSDEAAFEQIRANVFDIFKTVLAAALKACRNDENAARGFFADRLNRIPSGWNSALEEAQKHGDAKRACIEEIKLQASKEIRCEFEHVWRNGV